MASLISEKRNGRTLYRIAFSDGNKRRRWIRLAGVRKKDAQGICSRVEALASARISSQPMAVGSKYSAEPQTAIMLGVAQSASRRFQPEVAGRILCLVERTRQRIRCDTSRRSGTH